MGCWTMPFLRNTFVETPRETSLGAYRGKMSQTMAARVLVVGNSEEGTGPALSLSVVRVAEFSQEETPLLQVRFFWW